MRTLIYIVSILFCLVTRASLGAEASNWPRTLVGPQGGTATLYQPQIESWASYSTLEFRLAAVFDLPAVDEPIPANVRATAATDVDLRTREVSAYEIEIREINVPAGDEEVVEQIKAAAAAYLEGTAHTFPLDEVLAHFESGSRAGKAGAEDRSRALARSVDYRGKPPSIYVSQVPAVLLLFDGEPVFIEIEGASGLAVAVNTNWDLLRHGEPSTYYLRYENAWLRASAVEGPWTPAGTLPEGFSALPDSENFRTLRENLPGASIDADEVPRVIVSFEPAELIVIDGVPVEQSIPDSDLRWVSNTESDLFRTARTGVYLYLVSGRWFQAASLDGPWMFADDMLVSKLADIPTDHETAHVRSSVPGTAEAQDAVILATIPTKASVRRSEATIVVQYNGDPEFEPIAETGVYFAVNTHFDVFRVGRTYYVCHEGVWFTSNSANGPWKVSDEVPPAIYEIPPESPKHNVTYVYVYDSTPETVVVGYTSGYHGVYVSGDVVVYGTGWYYPPYVYYPPYGYPVYYAYPYSYGVAAYYNPYTGSYGRGAVAYGPYGGAGWGAAYNPSTGTYARGVSAWGPYEAGYAGQAYNPRTDSYAATYQRGNSYANWGETVVSRGESWAHAGFYSTDQGTVRALETSEGARAGSVQTDAGSAYVARDADNNVYAGSDGNVYRRDADGWSTYSDGNWETVDYSAERGDALARSENVRSLGSASKTSASESARSWSHSSKSASSLESLEQDWRARERGAQRSRSFDSWQRDSIRSGRRSGRAFGGRRGR